MLQMKKTLLFVISIFINVMSYAYDFKDGDCYYTITSLSDQTVALTNSGDTLIDYGVDYLPVYSPCYGGDFVVPTTAKYVGKEFTVTSIENSAFDKCKFSKLVIPENILSAKLQANSDLEIDQLIIEDSETPLEYFSAQAKEVYIGRNIISNSYWNSFYNVEKVTFGDNVTYLYESEFRNCPFTEVSLGKNITGIYSGAFEHCENLKTVRGAGVESVGYVAFSGCTSLESFDFPNLMSIGEKAFYGCTSLKNVILSETVTEIDERAFSHCTSLEEIYIPGTIESLGDGLFAGCDNLKKISVAAKNPVNIKLVESAFDTQTYINATLYVPAGSKEKYSNTAVWNNFFNIQEDASLVSTMCIVYVDYGYYGKVEYQGKQISYGEKIKVKIGEPFTLSFIPNDGYSLSEVTVNGDDWTNMVKNNQLTIPSVEGKIDLFARFDKLPVYLTIKQAENGSVKVKTDMGQRYQFVIEPAIGWSIHSVTFNGEDVTSQVGETGEYKTPKIYENSELIVAFEENTDGIAYQCQSKAKVSASSGTIMVRDAASTEHISIYNDSGMLIENVKGNGSLQTFSVPASQMYIVKVGDRTVKIGL